MDKKLFEKIKRASIDSIKNPGKAQKELPKQESERNPEVYVFRHGETHDNLNRVFSGWRDSKLTDKGLKQAEILSKKLKDKHIDICIMSPLSRTKETAEVALKYHKDMLFEVDERIIERNYGELQGKSKERMMQDQPELAIKYRRSYDFPPPNGESMKMVEERVFEFCDELVERVRKHNVNVAVSCHGNSMRAIRRYFEHLSIVEELTMENPLGQDYAEYVIRNGRLSESDTKFFTGDRLSRLVIPSKKLFKN